MIEYAGDVLVFGGSFVDLHTVTHGDQEEADAAADP